MDQGAVSEVGLGSRASKAPMILLVDDDEDQLDFFSALFHARGFEVVQALKAIDALAILEDVYVDLVVCDCFMPGMDGREFVERVRKTRTLKKIPVIEFSAPSASLAQGVIDSGADAFCSKDDHRALLATISSMIALNEEPIGLLKKIQARFG